MTNETKIREDLNDIAKDIKMALVKTRYRERKLCVVTVFNGDTVEFSDNDGLYDAVMTARKLGVDCVKNYKLVEEIQKNPTDENKDPTYICVLATLVDDKEMRLFPANLGEKMRINAYYQAYSKTKKKQ